MKFIIFDIDGTLTNTKGIDDHCFITSFKNVFDLDIRNEDWSKLKNVTDWGITEEIILREFSRQPTTEEFDLMLNEHVCQLTEAKSTDPDQFAIVEEADDFLEIMRQHPDFAVGIATGAWEKSARLKLGSFELDFDEIAFSNSSKFKSRDEITNDVIAQLSTKNGEPEEVIYFGDGEWDLRTCQKLGIRFIGIDCNTDGKLKALGVENIFKDYLDQDSIISIIKNG